MFYIVHWNCNSVRIFCIHKLYLRALKGRISTKCCGSVTHSLNTLRTSSPSLTTSSLLLSCPCYEGHHFHHHSIRLDSVDKSCKGLHKQQRFCWQMKFYYPAVSPVYASDFLTSHKRTLLLPLHQTKLYWNYFFWISRCFGKWFSKPGGKWVCAVSSQIGFDIITPNLHWRTRQNLIMLCKIKYCTIS